MSNQELTPETDPDTVMTFREWCDLIGVNRVIFAPEDSVMTFKEWIMAAGISDKSGRWIIDQGHIQTVQLSPNRIGIRVCDHRAWLASRVRKGPQAA